MSAFGINVKYSSVTHRSETTASDVAIQISKSGLCEHKRQVAAGTFLLRAPKIERCEHCEQLYALRIQQFKQEIGAETAPPTQLPSSPISEPETYRYKFCSVHTKVWTKKKTMGGGDMVEDRTCPLCDGSVQTSTSIDGLWLLCGWTGSGKTSLFNTLTGEKRPTSDTVNSVTDLQAMIKDILKPVRSLQEHTKHGIYFCDSEGIGAGVKQTEEETGIHSKVVHEQGAKSFVSNLKFSYDRVILGCSGVIFCIEAGGRVSYQEQVFMRCILETLGPVPVIICITKYDKLTRPGRSVSLDDLRSNGDAWLEANRREILKSLEIDYANHDHCFVKVTVHDTDEEFSDVRELIAQMERDIVTALPDKTKELRKRAKLINPVVKPTAAQYTSASKVADRAVGDLQKMGFFSKAMAALFGIAPGAIIAAILIPTIVLVSFGMAIGMGIDAAVASFSGKTDGSGATLDSSDDVDDTDGKA